LREVSFFLLPARLGKAETRVPTAYAGVSVNVTGARRVHTFFAALLALFAREAGAGRERMIVLGLDNAGWHTETNLAVPDGIRLVYLPRYYPPELQPAQHLWPVLDEPLANRYFATLANLERAVAGRCQVLESDQLSLGTNFHWWPDPPRRANQPEFDD
jgi:hypothetical protein